MFCVRLSTVPASWEVMAPTLRRTGSPPRAGPVRAQDPSPPHPPPSPAPNSLLVLALVRRTRVIFPSSGPWPRLCLPPGTPAGSPGLAQTSPSPSPILPGAPPAPWPSLLCTPHLPEGTGWSSEQAPSYHLVRVVGLILPPKNTCSSPDPWGLWTGPRLETRSCRRHRLTRGCTGVASP